MSTPLPPNFPSIYRDFVNMFPDEAACVEYLERLRWSSGFVCPACGESSNPWRQTRGRLVCPLCRHQCSATAGTIFDKTRTSLPIWFDAAWHVTTAKNGISAKTLEQTMGISYRVAWMMLHRFCVAMVRAARELLSGEVEVDEILIGGVETGGKRGRGTDKAVVAIAVEIKHPKGFGRIRMRHISDASAKNRKSFICETIAAGSTLCTEGWRGYHGLPNEYVHRQTILSSSDDLAHIAMPGVHQVASLLKRWLLGTHQGAFSSEHLQSYLEEFTFRFNRRTSHCRGHLFRRLLEQAVSTPPVTEAEIFHGFQWNSRK